MTPRAKEGLGLVQATAYDNFVGELFLLFNLSRGCDHKHSG